MALDLVFCGTYTDPSRQAGFTVTRERPVMGMTGPTGSEGIHVFARDRQTGGLTKVGSAPSVNPSFLALDPSGRFLFAVNEVRDFHGEESGAVSSFVLDRDTGSLRFISEVASGGGNPCHLSLSRDGRHLLVANHEAGNVAVLPVAEDGLLSPPVDIHQDQAVDHRRPHAHFITPDPTGGFVMAADTGTDRVMIYRQEGPSGRLVPHHTPWGQTHPGGSPRHLAFHPSGGYLFANGEADLTLSVFRYDALAGRLDYVGSRRTVDDRVDTEGHSTAQMLVHPRGRFVYVANRGTDTIAVFSFDAESADMVLLDLVPTHGQTPRNFEIDPSGAWLYVANQNSDCIECFAIDETTGALRHTGRAATVPAPTCIRFLAP
jgi:6-phosphogluconolactonase